MSSIPNQSLMTGPPPGQDALSDAQFSSYVRKQSVSAYESLDAGLTIQTKEGDLVTLTSNTYAQVDAFMYNSKGILQTDSGTTAVTRNQREITLTSGDSFSFSVVGDLSEEELQDIEAIVKGIDEIISEMAQGDMDDAVSKALSMGGYDSVSMYSADITYQRSYAMTSQTQARTMEPLPEKQAPAQVAGTLPETEIQPDAAMPVPEAEAPIIAEGKTDIHKLIPYPENHNPERKRHNTIKNMDQFVDRIAKKLEQLEGNLVDKIKDPIDTLFEHHLEKDDGRKNKGQEVSAYTAIDHTQKQVDKMIDQMVGKLFKNQFSAFF